MSLDQVISRGEDAIAKITQEMEDAMSERDQFRQQMERAQLRYEMLKQSKEEIEAIIER